MAEIDIPLPDENPLGGFSLEDLQNELAIRLGGDNQTQVEPSRPTCGSDTNLTNYNLPLHVAALVIILVLSTLACSFPIIAKRFPRLPIPHRFLFLSRHFGTGVLIATAFVHLLPTAFTSLTDPCLSAFWTDGYPAFAGLLAMLAVFMVVAIEMFFAIRGAGHVHTAEYGMLDQEAGPEAVDDSKRTGRGMPLTRFRTESYGAPEDTPYDPPASTDAGDSNLTSHGITATYKIAATGAQDELDSDSESTGKPTPIQSPSLPESQEHGRRKAGASTAYEQAGDAAPDAADSDMDSAASLKRAQEEQKALLQCLLLEAGILFHSVFIGMALSVAVGSSFVVLLIAISFHQTFEGLALGSRIAAIGSFGKNSPKPWLMALAYGLTTPIGQAIGLAVHNLYDPDSQTGLLMVGVMNAISSGLLLFAGLVELLAADLLSDDSYKSLKGPRRLQACGAVVAGGFLMALVGAWA